MSKNILQWIALGIGGTLVVGVLFFVQRTFQYTAAIESVSAQELTTGVTLENSVIVAPPRIVTHIPTPDQVRGIYMTSWVAATPSLKNKIIDLIDTTEINTVIIDIKDDTGKITFTIDHPLIAEYGSSESRIDDIEELIDDLHARGIYIIGRVAAFQDTYLAPKHVAWAVQKPDGTVWRDKKGLAWFDAGSKDVWEYIAVIAEESYKLGFDEINVDYVRYPSDGNMANIVLPITGTKIKSDVLQEFFAFLDTRLRQTSRIPLSADVFGMTTTNKDDLGIGQVFEKIVPYVDYIAPMIYPSHYPPKFSGYSNPASVPYEIITIATKGAVDRLAVMGEPITKLRPWLQDFNLGATYTADKVIAQIRALSDLGVTSWMMWDASNTYTNSAYGALLDTLIKNDDQVEL